MKLTYADLVSSKLKRSPGYYDCLNEIKTPKASYADAIKAERNDVDAIRQAALSKEDEDWVVVVKDMVDNGYCGR